MSFSTSDATARWLQGTARFSTTRWSVVLEAGTNGDSREEAMEEFCRIYWYPVYSFIRRRGTDPEPARDLTQGFFEKLLSRDWLSGLERKETRFSTLLCVTLKNFLASEYRRDTAQKRGGKAKPLSLDMAQAEHWFGAEPSTEETPERIFERRWAQAVVESALRRLESESVAMGKGTLYSVLHPFLSREPEDGEYDAAGAALGVDRRAIAVAVFRLRKQFKAMVREEVSEGLRDPSTLEDEMRHLAAAL